MKHSCVKHAALTQNGMNVVAMHGKRNERCGYGVANAGLQRRELVSGSGSGSNRLPFMNSAPNSESWKPFRLEWTCFKTIQNLNRPHGAQSLFMTTIHEYELSTSPWQSLHLIALCSAVRVPSGASD